MFGDAPSSVIPVRVIRLASIRVASIRLESIRLESIRLEFQSTPDDFVKYRPDKKFRNVLISRGRGVDAR